MSEQKPATGGERYVPYAERKGNESIVYFSRDLSAAGLRKLYARVSAFIAGRVAIMPMMFEDCYGPLRDMENAYSVLPYPKYDEAQQEYYTNSMDQHSVFGTPVTLPESRYEFLGIMMEALNAESWKTVFPAFYDTALKNKYSEDATTAQMIDLIMGGRVYEFSFQFGEYLQSLPYMFRNQLYSGQNNLASTLQKNQKSLNKLLEKVYAMYE